jgi:hypothetical protein
MDDTLQVVKPGYQLFVDDDNEDCGAVREVAPDGRDEVVVYVENGGEFVVPARAIRASHDQKLILDSAELEPSILDAIAHAHDAEVGQKILDFGF